MNCGECGDAMRLEQTVDVPEAGGGFAWVCHSCGNRSMEGISNCDVCDRQCLDRKYESSKVAIPTRLPEGCTACVTCNICGKPLGSQPRTYNSAGKSESGPSSAWCHLGCLADRLETKRTAYVAPVSGAPETTRPARMEDTSAGTILTFGILSLLCCPILFGPIAWIMGDKSLNLISSGRGNPNERGVVEAGRTLGMIGTALGILGLIIGAIRLASNN